MLRKLPPWAWRKVFERLVGSPGDKKGAGGGNKVLKTSSGPTVPLGDDKGDDDDDDDDEVVQEAVAAVRSVSLEDDHQDEDDLDGDDSDYDDEGQDGRSGSTSSSQQQTTTVAVSPRQLHNNGSQTDTREMKV